MDEDFYFGIEEEDQSSKHIKEVSQIDFACCSLKGCGGTIVLVSHCDVMSPVAFALGISCVNCIMYELSSEWFLLHFTSDLTSNCEMKKSGLLHSGI